MKMGTVSFKSKVLEEVNEGTEGLTFLPLYMCAIFVITMRSKHYPPRSRYGGYSIYCLHFARTILIRRLHSHLKLMTRTKGNMRFQV